MYDILGGLRVIEGASFIAAPSCGLHLRQLGAEVIRFDQIGGGPDFRRWPKAPGGDSLYWEGLNKGKKSVALDVTRPEGRELALALATAPGTGGGLFLTNYPAGGFLAHERLVARRADMITVRVMGWADGRNALDYTVNAAIGVPLATGPGGPEDPPVNHVLPAWDLITGAYAAFALLAAERRRRETGVGGEVRVPLADIAVTSLGHIGQIGEVMVSGRDRPRLGNDLFGAFGRDFTTRDGHRLMLVAITARQWSGLVAGLGLGPAVAAVERELGLSFARDEGLRFLHRDRLNALVEAAVAAEDYAALAPRLDAAEACFELYRGTHDAMTADPRMVTGNPVFSMLDHPSGERYPAPGAAATLPGLDRRAAEPAPRLGQHTDEVLAAVLGLAGHEIAGLHDRGIVASG